MKTVSRGILAVAGVVTGFFTLIFLFQFNRYLSPALAGNLLSLGMAAFYAVTTYAGAVITVLAFKPSATVAKYLSGVGAAITAGFMLSALYLFTVDLASGMMVLVIMVGQAVIVAVVYVGAVMRAESSDSESVSETTHTTESSESQNPMSESDSETDVTEPESTEDNTEPAGQPDTTRDSDLYSGRDIDWWSGAQIFVGATIFLIAIPITVKSPVGVPILLVGLALIPSVRAWSIETLGRSDTGNAD